MNEKKRETSTHWLAPRGLRQPGLGQAWDRQGCQVPAPSSAATQDALTGSWVRSKGEPWTKTHRRHAGLSWSNWTHSTTMPNPKEDILNKFLIDISLNVIFIYCYSFLDSFRINLSSSRPGHHYVTLCNDQLPFRAWKPSSVCLVSSWVIWSQ